MPDDRRHVAVLADEAVAYLHARSGGRYVDGTLGDGGHAQLLLESNSTIEVLGVDRDSVTLAATAARLSTFGGRFRTFHGNFDELGAALAQAGWDRVDGILLDLGLSSAQLDDPARGFGFRAAGALDMRMTQGEGPSAADLLATLDERRLAECLWRYGEEPAARRIARAIVAERERQPITDTTALADLVARVAPRRGSLHPATRVFQALRIAVNRELDHLDALLAHALGWLRPGARLVIIAYHSLEDRRVKRAFRDWATACRCPPALPRCICGARARVRLLTRKVVTPSAAEVQANRRARSARLRAVEVMESAG
ncbi:MAG: 16S rRNA (cytosine(1402)-N(4))-methyltransferase RsmH [Deltaproteobacteria bacterium]|nr:MAG: 16S rRNA (cytosine(1402)-N(4))-methyltransferase RsmH [Deltaproteobacteria bacterium]